MHTIPHQTNIRQKTLRKTKELSPPTGEYMLQRMCMAPAMGQWWEDLAEHPQSQLNHHRFTILNSQFTIHLYLYPTMNPTQQTYTAIAYQRMGIQEADWQPQLGFKACEAILEKLYQYYQAIYLLEPRFYWAGLARLTGGQVLYGMRNLVKIARDPSVITQGIMAAAKDIFDNIAWQHELFLAAQPQTENGKLSTPNEPTIQLLLQTCMETDQQENHTYKYHDCWQHILSGEPTCIALGNQMLLHNEQLNTIQRHYNIIKTDPYSARYFWFTRFVMRRIHPYHPRFIMQFPLGDVTCFPDRWQWITNPKGMWPAWVKLPEAERTRLVALGNDDVVRHRW